MGKANILITLLTIGCVSVSCLFSGPRDWWQSIKRKPFSFFIIVLSIVAFFLGGPRSTSTVATDPVDKLRLIRIILLFIMSAAALFKILSQSKRFHLGGSLGWFMGYAFLALVSSIYSPFPSLSLYKSLEVVTFIIMGSYIGTTLQTWRDIEDIIDILLIIMWYLVISALIGLVIAPSEAMRELESEGAMAFALTGVFPIINANTLTQISVTLACCSLCWLFNPATVRSKISIQFVFILSVICLVLGHSRTSIFSFLIVVFVVFMIFKKKRLVLLFLFLGCLSLPFFSLADYLVSYFMRGQNIQVFTSLSGRTNFWSVVIDSFWKSPILGQGFYASQRTLFGVSSVDNTYLEVLLNLGIVGFIVFCLAIFSVFLNLWYSRPVMNSNKQIAVNRFIWTELAVIYFILVVRSLTGPTFQSLHIALTLFVLVTVCSSAAWQFAKRRAPTQIEEEDSPEGSLERKNLLGKMHLSGN